MIVITLNLYLELHQVYYFLFRTLSWRRSIEASKTIGHLGVGGNTCMPDAEQPASWTKETLRVP